VAEIAVLRKGREVSLTARVEDLERATQRLSQAEESTLLGLAVEPLTPEVARKIGLRRLSGVVVTSVLEGSAASRARLDPGDVIFMVGDSEVSDAQGFASLIGEAIRKGKVVLLIRDVRTGRMGYIQVPVSGN
jgi:S1-C subfamily serine protease